MPVDHASSPGVFTILFVCTGNVCRSPLAERIGRAFLDETLDADDAAGFRLMSAGTQAATGSTMHPHTKLVLQGLGGDPAKFWALQLDATTAGRADLVLTMTRDHQRQVLEIAPRSLARTFTLREAAQLLELIGQVELTGDNLPQRTRALVQALAAARSRRRSFVTDDIPDPVAKSLEFHEEVGECIAEALLPLLRRVAELAANAVGEADTRPGTSSAVSGNLRPSDGLGSADDLA